MARRFTEPRLVVASHNPGKVVEIAALLAPTGIEALAAGDLGLAEPEETGASFAANALIKARAATVSGFAALADDSGLVIPALDGAPGIHSARWAGRDFAAAMARLESELAGHADPPAHFVCALALCWPDGAFEAFEGEVHGHLEFPPRGDHGFGYDPVFVPDGHAVTFGEMAPAEKEAISHRAVAFAKLMAACFDEPDGFDDGG